MSYIYCCLQNILITCFRKEIFLKEKKIIVKFNVNFLSMGLKKTFPHNVCFLKEPSTSLYLFIIIRILVPPYLGISSVRSTLTKWTVFSSILVFIHFILILESCATSGVHLEPYQTSMTKHLAIVLSQKCTIINIWQGSTYDSADSFLNIFPLSLLGYLNE